jgi:hypothetical protein
MKINHMICPNCRHEFYTDAAYGTCDSCQCCFYASQSLKPISTSPPPPTRLWFDNQLEAVEPVTVAVQSRNRRPDGWVPDQLLPPNVVQFSKKLDGLIDLLASTADALAATWDLRTEGSSAELDFKGGDDFKATIH